MKVTTDIKKFLTFEVCRQKIFVPTVVQMFIFLNQRRGNNLGTFHGLIYPNSLIRGIPRDQKLLFSNILG